MNLFVIGATGFVGGSLARSFAAAGHTVSGVARTDQAAAQLCRDGIRAVVGDLDRNRSRIVAEAMTADTVIYAAQTTPDVEPAVVSDLLDALTDTGSTFIFTSGSGVLMQRTGGDWSPDSYTEDDDFVVEPLAAARMEAERRVRAAAQRGIRSMVIRPGMIWGPGDHGHIAMIYRSVARTGNACYVGEGLNVYSNVHIDDVASLYAAAMSRGHAGNVYHAVAGETPTRWIAESVAADLGVSARSVSPAQSTEIWGEFDGLIAGASSRIRAPRGRSDLHWMPRHTDMLTTIGEPRLRLLAQPELNAARTNDGRASTLTPGRE